MFELIEPKMWASHLLREKAEANIAAGYPGAAIDQYRKVGMNECESTLDDTFASATLRDKLWQIDERQQQARRRIAANRRLQARMATEKVFDSKLDRRYIAQHTHEDEGIIMGLERLWCVLSDTYPEYVWEDAIKGGHR
jgi:hypothetical protein